MPSEFKTAKQLKDPVKYCQHYVLKCRTCGHRNKKNWKTCQNCGADMACGKRAHYPYKYCHKHYRKYRLRGHKLTTGERSNYPIVNVAAKYLEAKHDVILLSLRPLMEVAVLRFQQLLERVGTAETQERWRNTLNAFEDFKQYFRPNIEDKKQSEAWYKLVNLMEGAFHDYHSWSEIYENMSMITKLSESERKRLIEMKQVMTMEEGMEYAGQLFAANIKVLHDEPELLEQVRTEFIRIAGAGNEYRFSGAGEEIDPVGRGDMDFTELLHSRDEFLDGSAGAEADRPSSIPEGRSEGSVQEE